VGGVRCIECDQEFAPRTVEVYGHEIKSLLCDECGEKEERREKGRKEQERIARMRIPEAYLRLTWEDFSAKVDFHARDTCRAYAESWPHDTGLVLFGKNTGNGKSMCAALILREVGGLWLNVADLLAGIKESWSIDGVEEPELYRRARTEDGLLVLDDLGAEKQSQWVEEQLYRLIETRTANLRPMVMTTNLTQEELSARLGSRTMSRLAYSTDVVRFRGGDFRFTKKGKGWSNVSS
jgi:DNA replication protein DnaC